MTKQTINNEQREEEKKRKGGRFKKKNKNKRKRQGFKVNPRKCRASILCASGAMKKKE